MTLTRRWLVGTAAVVALASAGATIGAAQKPTAPASAAAPGAPTAASARELVDQAIQAMGGEARLKGIKSLQLDTVGHTFALEQSERPEGPWLTIYTQRTEIRDYEHNRVWNQFQRRSWTFPTWSPPQTTVILPNAAAVQASGRWVPIRARPIEDVMALDPERILLTARAAADLRVQPDETHQKVKQHIVAFTRNNQPIRLLLNPWTHLPTAVETTQNDLQWGDVVSRRWYSFWTLEKGGLMYPRQITTDWNGFPHVDETVQVLKVDEAFEDSKFAVPDDAVAASAKLMQAPAPTAATSPQLAFDEAKAIDVADGVVELPGGFNMSLVRQADGVVVIEGTSSPAYSGQVLAFAAKKFPGAAVKAMVTTSDAWPHIGGVREFVARGIPIYALDLNVSILTRMVSAPHAMGPDDLAKQPKAPVFRPVTEKTAVGAGDNRMEIIPVRGETGERMMVIWFPARHVLYSSDLIQHDRTGKGFFMPEMLMEVQAALDREHITGVDTCFGMHLNPTPWSEVTAAIAAAR